MSSPAEATASSRWVPFGYGFRPFFFAALLYAPLSIAAWLWMRVAGAAPLATLPPQLWHGHEMLFGFIAAAIAGFLLTAVPSWTGDRGFAGVPLMIVAALWLLGRGGFAFAANLPPAALAALELVFLPALAILIAPPLLRSRSRNTALLLVLAALWFIDARFLRALALGDVVLASQTLLIGIDVILLLITVIGGRVVPAFTANALKHRGLTARVRSVGYLELVTILSMVVLIGIDAWQPTTTSAAIVAGVAAILHLVRLAGWQGWRSLGEPIVWVLHAAYLWLPTGLALKAIFLATGAPWASQWLHALTMGAAAMMVVAVITRAALGHTGRPLVVASSVALAYGLLIAAVLVRVFLTSLSMYREWAVWVSGLLWIAAFAVIVTTYAPILLRPRIDGKPG